MTAENVVNGVAVLFEGPLVDLGVPASLRSVEKGVVGLVPSSVRVKQGWCLVRGHVGVLEFSLVGFSSEVLPVAVSDFVRGALHPEVLVRVLQR